jgi:D-tyrosyl-tRNA(Tyr) deacylase
VRAVIQRVRQAWVEVAGIRQAEIGPGLLVLIGMMEGDTPQQAERLARRCIQLRIFEDEKGRMNRSLSNIDGEILVVSQFTIVANTRKGNRPSFSTALAPDKAKVLYEHFLHSLSALGMRPKTGHFGARMVVGIENEGPVTIILEA